MNGDAVKALGIMARMVSETQSCVLEVTVLEDGCVAHLIPIEKWEEEDEDDSDDY